MGVQACQEGTCPSNKNAISHEEGSNSKEVQVLDMCLYSQSTNRVRKSAEDSLRAVPYTEEEITKTVIGTFNRAYFLGGRSISYQLFLQSTRTTPVIE